jgi:hypothetical protein
MLGEDQAAEEQEEHAGWLVANALVLELPVPDGSEQSLGTCLNTPAVLFCDMAKLGAVRGMLLSRQQQAAAASIS